MRTFNASLTNLTALLPQSRDYSCYVSRPILAPPPIWLQKHIDLRAHDFAQSPVWWHEPRFTNITYAWSWIRCGITRAIAVLMFNLGARWGRVGNATPAFYPGEGRRYPLRRKGAVTLCVGGWMCVSGGLEGYGDATVYCSYRGSNPRPFSP
jgi:hypothetical protein